MHICYAHVSAGDQNTARQLDELQASRCSALYQEHASSAGCARLVRGDLLRRIGCGDTLVSENREHSTINVNDLPIDVVGGGGGQKHCGSHQFLGLSPAPRRRAPDDPVVEGRVRH